MIDYQAMSAEFTNRVLPYLPFDKDAVCKFLSKHNAFESPASTKYHGAWPGGWFEHSMTVMKQLVILTDRNGLDWQRKESPYIVGFFHDVCKLDQYV